MQFEPGSGYHVFYYGVDAVMGWSFHKMFGHSSLDVAYGDALGDDDDQLFNVLRRNLFAGVDPGGAALKHLADYVRRSVSHLALQEVSLLIEGRIEFAPLTKKTDQ